MIIGVPKEIKTNEFRVAVVPNNVATLVKDGNVVYVEKDCGKVAGFSNEDYKNAGAMILDNAEQVYEKCEFIIKVKEILPEEFNYIKDNHIIFTYIHSANRLKQTEVLLKSKCVVFAMEDVKDKNGRFPLLEPMSEMAGKTGMQVAFFYSFDVFGGCGKLSCGGTGVKPTKVVILGGGNVGLAAAKMAIGMGADVTIMDLSLDRMKEINDYLLPNAKTVYSSHNNIVNEISNADIVLNCVKWFPGLTLITRDMLKGMKSNSLILDIDAEPHGAIETCKYSTFSEPVYYVDGIRHIAIPNLPGAVGNTSSQLLSNATLPYLRKIAKLGWREATFEDKSLAYGLDFVKGMLTFEPTAKAFNIEYTDVYEAINKVG